VVQKDLMLYFTFPKFIDDVYERGVIDTELRKINFNDISLREGKFETIIKKNSFYDKYSLNNFVKLYIKNNFSNNINVIEAATNYISNFIVPNIVFSEKETNIAKNIAEDKVSKNIGIVNEKERIVAKHERITPEIKQKIDS
jgi:membrane-associated HD superfamily phosphohydrolase